MAEDKEAIEKFGSSDSGASLGDILGYKRVWFVGLALFTLRNGNMQLPQYTKRYCQKLLLIGEGQYTPYHFHFDKMEDIICQAGGDLLVQVYNSDAQERLADTTVPVMAGVSNFRQRKGVVPTMSKLMSASSFISSPFS